MLTAVSDSLATRTGRSLEQWLALVRSCGVDPLDQSAVRNWLRREHSVPQNSQWAIADAAAREAGGYAPPSRSTSTASTPGPRPRFARSTTRWRP